MRFRLSHSLTLLALSVATAGSGVLQAQTSRNHLGPRVSYQFDLEEIGLGAQFSARIAPRLEFYPSFDIFLVDQGSASNLNVDLKYHLASGSTEWLYLGAGLNVARRGNGDSRTSLGANVLIGAELRHGRVHPFAEFRFTANDGSTGQLAAGLNFTI